MKWSEIKMARTEIIKEIDEFNREIYRFCLLNDTKLILDEFRIEFRETKRHKFKCNKFYERLRQRESTLTIDDVNLTEELKQEVIAEFMSKLEVIKSK
jgi:hypothetical protein